MELWYNVDKDKDCKSKGARSKKVSRLTGPPGADNPGKTKNIQRRNQKNDGKTISGVGRLRGESRESL